MAQHNRGTAQDVLDYILFSNVDDEASLLVHCWAHDPDRLFVATWPEYIHWLNNKPPLDASPETSQDVDACALPAARPPEP